jgi:hypothetical protein
MAIRASSLAVTARPPLRIATAFTALSCKRSTCSAALRRSDQRIAEVSKLPESALAPSAETASARMGPPCPRTCASAGLRQSAYPISMAQQIREIRMKRIRGDLSTSYHKCGGYPNDNPTPSPQTSNNEEEELAGHYRCRWVPLDR